MIQKINWPLDCPDLKYLNFFLTLIENVYYKIRNIKDTDRTRFRNKLHNVKNTINFHLNSLSNYSFSFP
jgi:hypothetical protein